MRRTIVLATVLSAGALSIAASASQSAPDREKVVRMQTLNVRDILYILTGGGGNALALMRDEGVVLIDTKLAGWGRAVLDAVEAVTDQPVTMIINTHAHPDHTGGNGELGEVTTIIAHEKAKARMATQPAFQGAGAKFLPNKTVTDRMTLLDGPDRIELYYFGRGHTDGDLVVVFPEKRLAHLGDLFPAKAAPFIDTANGGSAVELPKTLARIVSEIEGVVRVTTGHDTSSLTMGKVDSGAAIVANPRTMSWADFVEYAEFNRDFLAAVQEAIAAGKTAEEAFATLQLPARYSGYDMRQAKANVEAIYRELGR